MLRSVMLAVCVFALGGVSAFGEEQPTAETDRTAPVEEATRRDPFAISSDACGASQYRHLLGREFAQVYQTALLPADAMVQDRTMLRTLEYTPDRLNVVLGGEGRIIVIGCF